MKCTGRCGSGAIFFLKEAGVEGATEWDMAETARGGPFNEIAEHDIFVNCIYLMGSIPPFVTKEQLNAIKDRRLSVIVDVSCDYTNPSNPLPIYNQATTFLSPTVQITLESGIFHSKLMLSRSKNVFCAYVGPLDVVSIDHLPSMIPRESSSDFSHDLLPSIFELADFAVGKPAPVWDRAVALFKDKVAEALS